MTSHVTLPLCTIRRMRLVEGPVPSIATFRSGYFLR